MSCRLSCGAATGLAVEFIEPASAAVVVNSVAIELVIDGTKCVVIGAITAEVTKLAVG